MTLKPVDHSLKMNKFALIPTECSKCGRRFILERYLTLVHFRPMTICKECFDKDYKYYGESPSPNL